MGLFDEYDTPVDEIPTGFGLPNAVYEVTLTDIKKYVHNEVPFIIAEFTVTSGKLSGKKHTEWINIPQKSNTKLDKNNNPVRDTHASVLKTWLKNIGVPEDQMETFNPDGDDKDGVVGNWGTLELKPQKGNPQYQNASFKLDEDSEPSGVSEVELNTEGADNNIDLSKFA